MCQLTIELIQACLSWELRWTSCLIATLQHWVPLMGPVGPMQVCTVIWVDVSHEWCEQGVGLHSARWVALDRELKEYHTTVFNVVLGEMDGSPVPRAIDALSREVERNALACIIYYRFKAFMRLISTFYQSVQFGAGPRSPYLKSDVIITVRIMSILRARTRPIDFLVLPFS